MADAQDLGAIVLAWEDSDKVHQAKDRKATLLGEHSGRE